jgi:parallel beta-helix repeat protein
LLTNVIGRNNLFARNEIVENDRGGINLNNAAGSEVIGNIANSNGGDGIDSRNDDSATLTRNRANFNSNLGITADPGVINGGGNRAKGNGNPIQCLNIACL